MPLVKSSSKEAFAENVRREMTAGKPQNQAVAIAYSQQRRSKNYSDSVIKKAREKV